jgi:porin
LVFLWSSAALAYEINDKLSIGGVMAGVYQYQDIDPEFDDFESVGRGALPIQPEISFTPTDKDQIFAKFGFAAGNGLNEKTPFILAPWAADMEDDVKDINGRNRDYLLTAWYKHTFKFDEDFTLALTGGIIDATDYLDENAFANDEYTQFMNGAFVNGPIAFLPSYDTGGAVELKYRDFSIKGAFMNVGENDDGNNFNFYGVQLGYKLTTSLGEGNYRLIANFASEDFLDPTGESNQSRQAFMISCDQELGEILGAWIRFGFQDDDAAVTYEKLYSGGLNISGKLWGREKDNIGIGYGYLDGGNTGVDKTQVVEGYVRFGLNEYVALTLDVQYMEDKYVPDEGTNVDAWIIGARMTVEF